MNVIASYRKRNPKGVAYAILRVTIGINLMFHGLARLPKIPAFREWIISNFKDSLLPYWIAYLWGSILPILEFSIGLLLILGLFTYKVSIAGAMLIAILILGSCLIQKWEWAGTQMLYALFFYFIINQIDNNTFCLDKKLKNK